MNVRKPVVSGLLGAVAIVLGATQLGFIPVPTPAGHATIMHIPVILGSLVEGPGVGVAVGAIFGLFSWLQAPNPLFADPLVSVLPRLFIGPVAYYTYIGMRRGALAAAFAAAAGTLTNTVLVLGMAVVRGYLPAGAAVAVAVTHGLPEIILSILLTVPVVLALRKTKRQ